eukprot:88268-Amphidinium_carterae.1
MALQSKTNTIIVVSLKPEPSVTKFGIVLCALASDSTSQAQTLSEPIGKRSHPGHKSTDKLHEYQNEESCKREKRSTTEPCTC